MIVIPKPIKISKKIIFRRTIVKNKKTKVRAKRGYHIQDIDWKTLFKYLSKPKVIKIINELFSTNYDPNSNLEFIDTESFLITGFEDKEYVRSDLIAKIQKKHKNSKVNTIIIEFQTNSVKSMGYRMFVYTLNHSITYVKNGDFYCEPAQGITIYSNFDKPLAGFDVVNIREYEYDVLGTFKFKLKRNKKFRKVKYPFINILAMLKEDLASLEKTELDVFNIMYLYRYKKKKELLLDDDLHFNLDKARKIIDKYEGKEFEVLLNIFHNIVKDVKNILNENKDDNPEYGKVLDTMQNKYEYIKDQDFLKLRLDFDAEMAKVKAKISEISEKNIELIKMKAMSDAEIAKKDKALAKKEAETNKALAKKEAETNKALAKIEAEKNAEIAELKKKLEKLSNQNDM